MTLEENEIRLKTLELYQKSLIEDRNKIIVQLADCHKRILQLKKTIEKQKV